MSVQGPSEVRAYSRRSLSYVPSGSSAAPRMGTMLSVQTHPRSSGSVMSAMGGVASVSYSTSSISSKAQAQPGLTPYSTSMRRMFRAPVREPTRT